MMKRRTFMTGAAMSAAVAAIGDKARGAAPNSTAVHSPHLRVIDGVSWDKAPCRFCGTGCHVQVGVKDGKVVAIAGDRNAEVNKGLLCVKGYHVGLALYGKDRLTQPMLRVNGELRPISWDKALEVIADRVMKDQKGFAIYGSGQWTIPEGYIANKFMKGGLGNNNIDPNARLCMASAVTGFLSTYGVDEPAGCYDDLDACDVAIFWGNNPAEMHPVLFSRLVDRRSRGEKLRVIDIGTRRTRSTAFANDVLTIKPQGDLALANGILALLVKRGSYDKNFVEKHCAFRADSTPPTLPGKAITFAEFCKSIEPYTPAKVQELSGIAPKQLELLADLFSDRSIKITSLWCMGPNQHTQGTAVNNVLHGIHLFSGHFGRPGDAPTSLTGQPSACGTAREVGTLVNALPGGGVVTEDAHRKEAEELWNLPAGRINPKPGYHTLLMWKKFSTPTEAGGDISTIWVQVTNPGQSLPNINELFQASRKLKDKFLIVSDVYPTATTKHADLVLPSAMWVEKNGMYGNSERRTQQWFKMVSPPGDARDDAWQLLAVARKLFERGHAGMKDKDGNFIFRTTENGKEVPSWQWQHYYDTNVDRALFEEYRGFSRHKHKDLAPYDEYVKARGLRWPVVQQANGVWKETRFRFSEFDDPYVKKGSNFDFYHSTSKDGRAQIWFRPHVDPPEKPDEKFPFWLCTGRVLEHWHTGTMTMRIPQLRTAMPSSYIEFHPYDASTLGVNNGDWVRITSRRGSVELPAWIAGRGEPVPGSVFVPFFDETMLINLVTHDAADAFSKQPDYKKCAVRLERIAKPSKAV
jgi:nitrate reductase (cytochrome)